MHGACGGLRWRARSVVMTTNRCAWPGESGPCWKNQSLRNAREMLRRYWPAKTVLERHAMLWNSCGRRRGRPDRFSLDSFHLTFCIARGELCLRDSRPVFTLGTRQKYSIHAMRRRDHTVRRSPTLPWSSAATSGGCTLPARRSAMGRLRSTALRSPRACRYRPRVGR
jgi:hypothetical protein